MYEDRGDIQILKIFGEIQMHFVDKKLFYTDLVTVVTVINNFIKTTDESVTVSHHMVQFWDFYL